MERDGLANNGWGYGGDRRVGDLNVDVDVEGGMGILGGWAWEFVGGVGGGNGGGGGGDDGNSFRVFSIWL